MAAMAIFYCGTHDAAAQVADQLTNQPVVVSTWKHRWKPRTRPPGKFLEGGGTALDAVELGVRESEADPAITSVGYGGLPDRDGQVTLDACIMNEQGNCGSVAFLSHIKHPISVWRDA